MPFPPDVVERLLVACHRHCCICHKPAGTKMEIHHILPKSQGGEDTEDNGIPLCFDCHAEVAAYDPQHPKGKRFTPSELKRHKEQWFAICSRTPWDSTLRVRSGVRSKIERLDDSIFSGLRLEDPGPAERLVSSIMRQDKVTRAKFAMRVIDALESGDEDTRWKFAMVVKELVLWEPKLVPFESLEAMSRDPSFFVRSSAAVCYYYLAALDPSAVPVDILSKLAAHGEDWYVHTPARSALLRLARARPIVIDILARDLSHEDATARELAASSIRRLMQRDWDLIPDGLVSRMMMSTDSFVKKVGEECCQKKRDATKEPQKDYSLF